MVLPASTAAEGQAAQAEWLRQVRRWLQLGHEGVLVMIRDAQLAQLRPLVRVLESLDPALKVTSHAQDLLEGPEGALVLLLVRDEDLGWMNLNRPIFAQRSLRVVLWVEPGLSDRLKFASPDLHDWISHFVPCPEGVPEFAVEGLRIGSSWWPGVAWKGSGLELALAQLNIEVTTLRPDAEFERLVATLASDRSANVRWDGVHSVRELWRIRWAMAEAQHHGFCVLASPDVAAPGWFPVSSVQLDWATVPVTNLMQAIELEFEPEAMAPETDGRTPVEAVGLLLRPGPKLRQLHGSPEIEEWRRQLVRAIQEAPEHAWSRAELAMFASLERERSRWPIWTTELGRRYTVEHMLRSRTHGGELPDLPSSVIVLLEEPEIGPHPLLGTTNPSVVDTSSLADAARVLTVGDAVGWDVSAVVRAMALVATQQLDQPEALRAFLCKVMDAAKAQLGPADRSLVPLIQIAAVATAVAGDPWAFRAEFEQAIESRDDSEDALVSDWAAILTLCGHPSVAAKLLRRTSRGDSPATRLYIAVLLAAGQANKAGPELERILGARRDPLEYVGDLPNANERAREFLRARLDELAHQHSSWPFTAPDKHSPRCT